MIPIVLNNNRISTDGQNFCDTLLGQPPPMLPR